MSDPDGNWPTWGQIAQAAFTVAVAAAVVVAVVSTAGAAGAAIGVAAGMYLGVSTSTAVAIGTAATIGAYTVAAGIGACALSDAGEILTGTNVVRDKLMGGNQEAYDSVKSGFNLAGMGIAQLGANTTSISKPSKLEKIR